MKLLRIAFFSILLGVSPTFAAAQTMALVGAPVTYDRAPLAPFVAPVYPGGENALIERLTERLRYPELAREYGVEGTVVVRLQLAHNGKVATVEVVRGLGFGCDRAALKAIKKLHRWQPALRYGKRTDSVVYLPIRFRLE